MKIECLASSSAGNAYVISDGKSKILLEAGLPFKKLEVMSEFAMYSSNFACTIISHEHQDHCKSLKDLLKLGTPVYASAGTWTSLGYAFATDKNIYRMEPEIKYHMGSFTIIGFKTQHDAMQPFGFVIYSRKTKETLLFATDTFYIKNVFNIWFDYIMVECNYAEDILQANLENKSVDSEKAKRLRTSHFELVNVKKFLLSCRLRKTKRIYLMHLSNRNSDEARFLREIQELTGKDVIVCGE